MVTEPVYSNLTQEAKFTIYKWAGEGYSKREIIKMFNRLHPKHRPLRISTVDKVLIQPEAHKFVSKFRVEFLKTVKHIPIADKKIRLDDLESIRQRIMHLIVSCHFSRSDKEINRFLLYSKKLLDVLDLARNEMDQKSGIAIGIGLEQGELGELDDKTLQKQRDDLLRKADISIKQRFIAPDEIAEGDEETSERGSSKVFLAPSEELRREELQPGESDVSDVR